MLNVHSVSEVNILHDSSGVLRVIIGCQDAVASPKKKHPTVARTPRPLFVTSIDAMGIVR